MDPIPITSAKLDANRANAQHSTGPRTEQGKQRSAMNARTNGLCSDTLLIPGEDPEELELLKNQYKFQIEPSTPIERTLFKEILGGAWKLQRIQRLESEAYAQAESSDAMLDDDKLQKKLDTLARHKARIERSFYRALKEMKAQQTNRAILQMAIQAPLPFPLQADARHFAKQTQPARTPPSPPPPAPEFQNEPTAPENPADLEAVFVSSAGIPACVLQTPGHFAKQTQPAPTSPPPPAPEFQNEPTAPQNPADLEAVFAEMDELFLPNQWRRSPTCDRSPDAKSTASSQTESAAPDLPPIE